MRSSSMFTWPAPRRASVSRAAAGVALLATLAGAAPAAAQIGAFGGTTAISTAAGDESAHYRMPILMESAVFSPAGVLGGALSLGVTAGSVDVPGFVAFDYRVTQTVGAVHYAVSDRAVIGAAIQPWNEVSLTQGSNSESVSGRGDAALYGKLRVWESQDRRSAAAISGSLGLPMGADGFGAEGVSIGASLALSRQLDGASVHGAVGTLIPTDDLDGEPVFGVSAGLMYRVGGRASIGAELLTRFSDGEYIADLAPGLRFQLTPRLLLDSAFLVNVGTSLDGIYNGALLVAVRFGV